MRRAIAIGGQARTSASRRSSIAPVDPPPRPTGSAPGRYPLRQLPRRTFERRDRVPCPHRAAEPQAAVARVVGLLRLGAYADYHDIEYNAIREAAALIDVSPALQVPRHGAGRDPPRRPGHHPRRDEALAPGRSTTRPGATSTARSSTTARSTASTRDVPLDRGRPAVALAAPERRRPRRDDRGRDRGGSRRSPSRARSAGPSSRPATGEAFADLRYFRRRADYVQGRPREGRGRRQPDRLHRRPRLRAVDPGRQAHRTSGTADEAGGAYGIRPAGMLALDVVRLEAGLILLEVDYTSRPPRDEPGPELQPVRDRPGAPGELRQGRLRRAASAPRRARPRRTGAPAGRPEARLVRHRGAVRRPGPAAGDLADPWTATRSRCSPGGRQVGKATSHGWSPILKQAIALASVPPAYERAGARLEVEWTVEGRRGRVRPRSWSCRSSTWSASELTMGLLSDFFVATARSYDRRRRARCRRQPRAPSDEGLPDRRQARGALDPGPGLPYVEAKGPHRGRDDDARGDPHRSAIRADRRAVGPPVRAGDEGPWMLRRPIDALAAETDRCRARRWARPRWPAADPGSHRALSVSVGLSTGQAGGAVDGRELYLWTSPEAVAVSVGVISPRPARPTTAMDRGRLEADVEVVARRGELLDPLDHPMLIAEGEDGRAGWPRTSSMATPARS